jgi:hypothetical protein
VGGPADVSGNGTAPEGSSADGGEAEQSGVPDEATTAPAHVPVKKKGTRKR